MVNNDRSTLPGLVRVSFGCYNTFEEIDWLVEMVQRVVAGDYAGDCVVDRRSGSYFPRSLDALALRQSFSV